MRSPFTTIYDPRNPAHRTVPGWHSPSKSWQAIARAYASVHGEAKVLRMDGSVLVYRRDTEGKVRQQTYQKVHFVREP